jgi:hypothetical protein
MAISTFHIGVFVVLEEDPKLGNKLGSFHGSEKRLTKTRKRESRGVAWRCFHVTVRTDPRDRSFAREELSSMTVQASCVFGKLGDVGKRSVAFTNLLPVFSRELVT